MAYSEFTLSTVKKQFNLNTLEDIDVFTTLPEAVCSDYLAETLRYNVPLALANNSEKARSEMIIAPILIEVRKQLYSRVSLFSGIEFNVALEHGLNGYCDYLFSSGAEQLFITAPVMMLVEAKNENLKGGLGQCVAEMVAAQRFNEQEGNSIATVYGAVTSGTNWQFLQLSAEKVTIDLNEYYLANIDKILGIIIHSIQVYLKP